MHHRRGPRRNDRGFSHPHLHEPIAGLDGRRHDRITRACGFPPDEAEEERRRERLNELREREQRLIGSEYELRLLLDVVTGAVTLRALARQTNRDTSVVCRRYPRYLAKLRAAAAADPELRALLSDLLGG
jgi:hypothetical protein